MLSESLRVPYRTDDALGTILVGSVLTLLTAVLLAVWTVLLAVWPPVGLALTPVVALPSLVMRGYLLRVVYNGIGGTSTLSSFVRWGALVRAGSKSALLSAIYFLPGAVLCGLAVGGGVATAVSPQGFDETAQALTGVLILIAGFGLLMYGLVYLYVRPAARAVLAATGSVRAALGLRRVGRLAATGDYLTGWLIAMGVLAVGPAILVPLLVIAGIVGFVSPVVALLIVLATLLLGVGSAFVFRVSAAWSTGQGAASGLETLYPEAVGAALVTDEVEIVGSSEQATPKIDGGSAEVDPLVQTGRTVVASHAETPAEETTDSVSSVGSDGGDDGPTARNDTGPADRGTGRVDESTTRNNAELDDHDGGEPDDQNDAEPDGQGDAEPDDEEGDPGFVWVDDGENDPQ